MSDNKPLNLLARLARQGGEAPAAEAWSQVAATQPQHEGPRAVEVAAPEKAPANPLEREELPEDLLDRIRDRIEGLVGDGTTPKPAPPRTDEDLFDDPSNTFLPMEPKSLREAGLNSGYVEQLILKYLLTRGTATGREVADQIKLPFKIVEELMRQLKQDQLVIYRNSATIGDYEYQITDTGRERGRRFFEQCTYFGAAPVSLKDYINSVKAQSMTNQHPTPADLQRAFHDLLLNPKMMARLGPAVNSGRGLFLFGGPGNGKTSIAERITRAFGQTLWIPRALGVDGEVIRLFDPVTHEELPLRGGEGLLDQRHIDKRWVRIRRPTIVVGGELTMENLEITFSAATGISEAPVQLKSNCGTLVIDDFGRQKMRVDELLNRWIVPLEKRYDFLNLANGKKLQVPFDQLIVFSTNLEPKQLVDDAFLRRIPYKIEVVNPSEEEFISLFRTMCGKLGFEYRDAVVQQMIAKHFRSVGRPMRCCHPRDLLMQVRNKCFYEERPLELTEDSLDFAVESYFSVV